MGAGGAEDSTSMGSGMLLTEDKGLRATIDLADEDGGVGVGI